MSYYNRTFKLLGKELVIGEVVPSELPASVGEWYSFKNGYNLLVEYSNQDSPLRPNEFEYHTFQNHRLAVFLHENQDVCWWAFEMDEADDPPVYVNINHDKSNWISCCDTFSTFIFTRVFDFRYWGDPARSISGSGSLISIEVRKSLRDAFMEQPTTYGFPGDVQYRFQNEDQRIFIWENHQQADWHFTADTSISVMAVFNKYKHHLEWHTDLPGG